MQTTSDKYAVPYAIELNELWHTYRVDGNVKPGYSEIMESVGLKPLFYSDDPFHREFGRAGHEATSLYDAGRLNLATLDPRLIPALDCYRDFLEVTRFKVRANEKPLYSRRHGFCTRIDRAGIMNFRFGIVELKFGTSVDWSTEQQLSAHQVAWEDNFLFEPICFKYVLHLRRHDKIVTPSTKWTWSLVTKWTDTSTQTWLSVLDWYKLKKKRGH